MNDGWIVGDAGEDGMDGGWVMVDERMRVYWRWMSGGWVMAESGCGLDGQWRRADKGWMDGEWTICHTYFCIRNMVDNFNGKSSSKGRHMPFLIRKGLIVENQGPVKQVLSTK